VIKKLMILSLLCLTIVIGGTYFIIWPMALQYLTAITTVFQPAIENIQESIPALPQEGEVGFGGLIAILPILKSIGTEGLVQIKEIAEGGVTKEEAQQALDILLKQLSADELLQLRTLLNIQ
jgi:hypothetical protein